VARLLLDTLFRMGNYFRRLHSLPSDRLPLKNPLEVTPAEINLITGILGRCSIHTAYMQNTDKELLAQTKATGQHGGSEISVERQEYMELHCTDAEDGVQDVCGGEVRAYQHEAAACLVASHNNNDQRTGNCREYRS
jgi:hypothetical protein